MSSPIALLLRLISYLRPTRTQVSRLWQENVSITLLVLFYLASSLTLDQPTTEALGIYPRAYLNYAFSMSGFGLVLRGLVYCVALLKNFSNGFRGMGIATEELFQDYLRFDRLVGFIVVLIICPLFFSAYTRYKIALPYYIPFSWDLTFVSFDRWLHAGSHPWQWLHSWLSEPIITVFLDRVYYHGWFILWTVSFVTMAWCPNRILRIRFFVTTFASWIVGGTILAYLFSSAGPCYLELLYDSGKGYQELFHYLNSVHQQFGLQAINGQAQLWQGHLNRQVTAGIGISAMPSMHLSMVTVCVLAVWKLSRLIGVGLLVMLGIILVGSIHLGWHYAIDGYVSIILTAVFWVLTGKIYLSQQTKAHK